MIDLHLHTTASDGACAPATLVQRAWMAGLRTISVTDHDTTGGIAEARHAAAACGLRVVSGIEITAVRNGRDVHVLGYFFDPDSPALAAFLAGQRTDRVERAREIGRRLAAIGKPIDVDAVLRRAHEDPTHSVGRPAIAQALVAAGHAADRGAAFDAFIGERGAAYVPRTGAPVADVSRMIREAGGITSLAHPILLRDDACIAALAEEGLSALEVYHSEHDPADVARYLALAGRLGLAVTGGSDFHGETRGTRALLGMVTLGADHLVRLESLVPPRASS